jgi:hypothetical protein
MEHLVIGNAAAPSPTHTTCPTMLTLKFLMCVSHVNVNASLCMRFSGGDPLTKYLSSCSSYDLRLGHDALCIIGPTGQVMHRYYKLIL